MTSMRTIQLALNGEVQRGLQVLLDRLVLLGEACYREAMSRITYTHRTGNLGSSTGYIVLNEGVVYSEGGFLSITGPEKTDVDVDGTLVGREYAESLIPEWSTGFAMIFVAGMEYAGYVEAKGYNVITSAHIWAEQNAQKIVNSLFTKGVSVSRV